MIDSRTAVQIALYDVLSDAVAVTSLADVWAPPPENTEPTPTKGVVVVGLANISNEAAKDGDLDSVEIDLIVYTRTPDPTDLYTLSTAVRNAVEDQPVAAPGALIEKPEFVSAESDMMEDGKTFADILRFRMLVQPA